MSDGFFDHLCAEWADAVATLCTAWMAWPAVLALAEYHDLDEMGSLHELVDVLDPPVLLHAVNSYLPTSETLESKLADLEEASNVSLRERERLDEVWTLCVEDDADWERALQGLHLAAEELLEEAPSHLQGYFETGLALGQLGVQLAVWDVFSALHSSSAALNSVVGILDAQDIHDERVQRAAKRWDLEVQRFAWSTNRWRSNAKRAVLFYLFELCELLPDTANVRAEMERTVEGLERDLEVLLAERLPPVDLVAGDDRATCPHCGTLHLSHVRWCEVCEVAL